MPLVAGLAGRRAATLLLTLGSLAGLSAQVTISELHAAPSERLLRFDQGGALRLGSGVFWGDTGFHDGAWREVAAPAGFGFPDLATNLAPELEGLTSALYLRRRFTLPAGAPFGSRRLVLRADFNDGFIAYLNGREVARSHTGPKGLFLYADQTALVTRADTEGPEDFVLGNAADLLLAGENILAVQVHNASEDAKGNLRFAAELLLQQGAQATTLFADDFNAGNGAAIIHRHTAGTVENTSVGTPPAGSWLALAPPAQSAGWQQYTATTRLALTSGGGGSGALEFNLAATGSAGTARLPGPAVDLRPFVSPGQITEEDLAALEFAFHHRSPTGFVAGVTIETEDGTASLALPDLPPRLGISSPEVTGYWRFEEATAANAVAIATTASETNNPALAATGVSSARYSTDVPAPVIFDPLTGTARENRFSFNAAAADSRVRVPDHPLLNSGSFTVEFFIKLTGEPTGFDAFLRRGAGSGSDTAASSSRRSWQVEFDSGTTAAAYGRVRTRWDTPGIPPADWNRFATGGLLFADTPSANGDPAAYPGSSDPQAAGDGINDAATRKWRHVALTWDGAGGEYQIFTDGQPGGRQKLSAPFQHPAALLEFGKFASDTYGLHLDEIRYSARVLKPAEFLRAFVPDASGFRPWSGTLRTAPAAQRQRFLERLNAAAIPRLRLVLEVLPQSVSSGGSTLVIDDLVISGTRQATDEVLIGRTGPWRAIAGHGEPSGGVWDAKLPREPNPVDQQFSVAPFPDTHEFSDWIELRNAGPSAVSLDGWSLTDHPASPQKWRFPAGTSIPAGGHLLVLADGQAGVPGLDFLHTNFKLAEEGETVQLLADGVLRDSISYPPQDAFHSFGRSAAGWVFFSSPTPGAPNAGQECQARVKAPELSLPGGFHGGPQTLTLTTETPDAVIRYTSDGTEPDAATSTVYAGPITLAAVNEKTGRVIRAKAFRDGFVASGTTTATYLIDQHPALRSVPALILTGDPQRDFYKPFGIMSIEGGTVDANNIWSAAGPRDYNLPQYHGRAYERPVFVEWRRPDGAVGFAGGAGLRLASSPFSRPRLKLQQTGLSPWTATPFEKPSFNVIFRDSYDQPEIDYPLLGEFYPVQSFDQFRVRAGKNDIVNPFIKDELIRRVFSDMGNLAVRGTINTLYLNAAYKGYYNTVERYRASFFQSHYRTTADWDILIRDFYEDGDPAAWTGMMAALGRDLSIKANYDAALATFDPDAVIDYFLINIYTAQADWPNNNWVAARERSPEGRYRLYLWDSEISFAQNASKPVGFDTIQSDLRNLQGTLPALFRAIHASSELRLRFADRIHRHFFNGGALDDRAGQQSRIARIRNELAAQLQPLLQYSAGQTPNNAFLDNWMAPATGRRRWLFDSSGTATDVSFRKHGLWPVTEPPVLSQHGGELPSGAALILTKPAGAAPSAVIHFTLDGSDPRRFGGAAAPSAQVFTSPIVPPAAAQFTVSARVRNPGTGEWSPLTQAVFTRPAVPASAANLVVSQIHYHPVGPGASERAAGFADADDFEFLELTAAGGEPVSLAAVTFTSGLNYTFTSSDLKVLLPGERVLLVSNRRAFMLRYGARAAAAIAGEYTGRLANSGERLRLTGADGPDADELPDVIQSFTYRDTAPWPDAADGRGPSLVLSNSAVLPDHADPASWSASPWWGGNPGGVIAPVDYHSWREALFGGQGDSLTEDPDADGLPDLLEFAFGKDPHRAGDSLPGWQLVDDSGQQVLELSADLNPQAAGLSLVGQSTADLRSWATLPVFSETVLPGGALRRTWRLPVSGSPPRWLRLRAIVVP